MDELIEEINALKVKLLTFEMALPQFVTIEVNKLVSIMEQQQRKICALDRKCQDLETIQMNLIASIKVASPETFSTICAHAEQGLSMLSEQDRESDYGRFLQQLIGISQRRAPHLWLVPPCTSPDSDDPDPR